jgi:hypothetical protein
MVFMLGGGTSVSDGQHNTVILQFAVVIPLLDQGIQLLDVRIRPKHHLPGGVWAHPAEVDVSHAANGFLPIRADFIVVTLALRIRQDEALGGIPKSSRESTVRVDRRADCQ